MVAVKAADVEKFLARPDPARPIVLVYGPDAGLVHERAEALVRCSVDDPRDPFQLARLEGDEVAAAPLRLVEEANTVPLFGGRRAVWVKAGARNLAPAVEALIASTSPDCRVVIEAGELRPNAPVRAICERARNAVTLPCYPDKKEDLLRLIDEEMRDNGISISSEARATLLPLLGGDRLASRHELRKLALFARGTGRAEVEDVIAVVADASALALDDIIDAAFAGRSDELEHQFTKTRTAATSPGTIISAALRHVAQLHKGRLAIENGATATAAVEGVAPFLRFARKSAIETALKCWTSARLARTMAQLADAALQTRRQSTLAGVITQRALLSVAVAARKSS